jgi:hypothetical protein
MPTRAAAVAQPLDLLGEHVRRGGLGQRAEGFQQLAGRADRAGHDHVPLRRIGNGPRVACGEQVQLARAFLQSVLRQPTTVAAERVGQDNVGASLDEALVQAADAVGVVGVPQLGRRPTGQPRLEKVGARRAVREQPLAALHEFLDDAFHPSGSPRATARSFGVGRSVVQPHRPPRTKRRRFARAGAPPDR